MPLHGVPPDPGRRVRTGHPGDETPWPPAVRARTRAGPDRHQQRRHRLPAADRPWPGARPAGEHPDARLVAGSTDWGVELNIRHARAELTVALDRVAELRSFTVAPDRIEIGAALTLSEVERLLDGRVPLLAELFRSSRPG